MRLKKLSYLLFTAFCLSTLNTGCTAILAGGAGAVGGYFWAKNHRPCPHCDKQISDKASVCPHCHKKVEPLVQPEE